MDLKSSVISMFDFNLFGIPMIGSDICGFGQNSNEELCARWIQVGAFYPFSRNHNHLGGTDQELYRWESVTETSIIVLNMRYRLLPYMYTLFYGAHSNGETVINSLWFNYPQDKETYSLSSYQFMWGHGVLFTPVVEKGSTVVTGYFPAGLWYNFQTMLLEYDTLHVDSSDRFKTLDTPLLATNVHLAGGHILPTQDAAMTTTESRLTNISLLVPLSHDGAASGTLFWDDGEQMELRNYLSAEYGCKITGASTANNYVFEGSVDASVLHDSLTTDDMDSILYMKLIVIMGKDILKSAPIPSKLYLNKELVLLKNDISEYISYNYDDNKITIKMQDELEVAITTNFSLTWY